MNTPRIADSRETTSTRRIAILGTGGHARVLIAMVRALKVWEPIGLLDRQSNPGEELISGVPVIGSWQSYDVLWGYDISHVAIALGNNTERKKLYTDFCNAGFFVPTLIHPTAYVDPTAEIGAGVVICMGALVGANAVVGSNTIINSGSIIDHECRVGSNVHITPGCRIAGRVDIGDDAYIGIGTTILDKVRVGSKTTVGAGAVVVSDIPAGVLAYGVPARVVKEYQC